jgi:hypothetical protein
MTVSPTYDFRDLGPQARRMARYCKNERLALTMKCVDLSSMIAVSRDAAVHLMKEMFGHTDHHGRSK